MRIDYNEPKKSYTSQQTGSSRPRNESSGPLAKVVIITCLLSLGVGFGSGWMLSQRSAKKGFKKALEQQSLENSPRQPEAHQPQPAKTPPAETAQQPPAEGAKTSSASPAGQTTAADPQLSFYKNLPSGQKSNVLGSGVNARDEKTARQPLQAAIPLNMAKPAQPQTNADSGKPPVSPPVAEKTAARPEVSTFTVQVASLSLKSEAEALKNKLSNKGYNVHISESNQGNKGTWYRVRVGRGMQQESAKELADKLGKGAMVIPDKD